MVNPCVKVNSLRALCLILRRFVRWCSRLFSLVCQDAFGYHGSGNRGAVALPLLQANAAELTRLAGRVSAPPDAKVMDIRLKDTPIRADVSTSIMCMWVEVPSDVRYHAYDFQVRGEDGDGP